MKRSRTLDLVFVLVLVIATLGLGQDQVPGENARQTWRSASQYRESLQPDITLLDKLGQPQPATRCGTRSPSPLERELSAAETRAWLRDNGTDHLAAKTKVPVQFHVIYYTKGGEDIGRLSRKTIKRQISVMNKGFKKHGFKFVLDEIDYTKSKKWFKKCDKDKHERKMKKALSVDPSRNLNIYSCEPGGGLLGYAYFPESSAGEWWDGIVALHSSLPGGSSVPYDEGDTITHEAGHWAGLYHTFENGCDDPGDLVDDTPAEQTPAYECTLGRDTCPGGGEDPIENFMDYTPDACMDHLSKGQGQRAKTQVAMHRADL